MVYSNDDYRERQDHLIASCQDRMLAEAGDTVPCCGNCSATFPLAYRGDDGELIRPADLWCDEHGWVVSPYAPACERYRES